MKKLIKILFSLLAITFLISCGSSSGGGGGGASNNKPGGIEAESGIQIKVNAQEPLITGNPQGGKYKAIVDGSTVSVSHKMTVNAEVTDGGALSYQWYKSETNKINDLAEEVGNSNTYTVSLAAGEEKTPFSSYYYCKVTNTISNNGDGGTKTVSVYSDIAEVYFGDEDVAVIPTVSELVGYYDEEPANDINLTISASTTDGGTLSYQWFSSSSLNGKFQAVASATEATLTLNKEAAKEKKYYYVEVTNTKDGLTQAAVSNKVLVQNLTGSLGYLHPSKYLPQEKYSPVNMNSWKTANYDYGAYVENDGTTFAVYSENATRMLLEIYEASGKTETLVADYWMEKNSDNVWCAKVNGLENGHIYAFRAWGPNWPFNEEWKRGDSNAGFIADYDSKGNRFNPNKVLFDPYAKEMTHDRSTRTGLSGVAIYTSGKENRHKDTGDVAPKAYVIDEAFVDVVSTGTKPNTPLKDSIIYEAHVRGITKHPSSANLSSILEGFEGFENVVNIPEEKQGTYAGAALLAPYLKSLGITAIELLPVHESDNDSNPSTSSGGNYWAYMTYGYFAPDRRYSSDKTAGGPIKEFKSMVKAFHDAGIEVYLDVVFNHSGEGGPWNGNKDDFQKAELNFMRGLDNANWYSLVPGTIGAYWENTGCGNNLQCDNEMVRQFILDSLTYWIDEMGVDGFRFDLAPVLGRVFDGEGWPLNTNAKTLTDIASLGVDKNAKMIAEAWDAGGGYAVGDFPTGWADWNGKFRDEVRRFLKNDGTGNILKHIAGSEDMYSDVGGPHNSINFIVAHDGLTLTDLVSFPIYGSESKEKYNKQAWPFGPSDGGSDGNDCWDSTGLETKTWYKAGNYNTQAFRRQRLRNFWVLQMFSRGVPMIVWGDEYGRTQNGNNNPYNVDSVATWSNYNMINTDSPHTVSTGGGGKYTNSLGTDVVKDNKNNIFLFSSKLMNFRLSEELLCQDDYTSVVYNFSDKNGGTAKPNEKSSDILVTIKEAGATNPAYAMCICRNENAPQTFNLPSPGNGYAWTKFIDTSYAAETVGNIYTEENTVAATSLQEVVPPQSIVVYKLVEVPGLTYIAAPTITAESEIYNYLNPPEVTITCETAGATIYYSINGGDPIQYSDPFKLPTIEGTYVITAYGKLGENSIPAYSSKTFTATKETVVTVYFDNTNTNWSKVACYQWDANENKPADWPGTEMTKVGSTNYYSLAIPLNFENIIFNNNGAGEQTVDLTIPSETDLIAGKVLFVPSTKTDKWSGTWQTPSF
ncbi:MAG: starch-binding protein [Spirochaetaceae bacterium]|nr:starch-binding protein [Spirochaetaceae bacterium]